MERKSKLTALLLSIFLGGLGVDRFYLGYTGMGVLKLLTAGGLGIISLIDIIQIATGKLKPADGSEYVDDLGETTARPQTNNFDDLEKAKKLLDEGIISVEDFNKIKEDILRRI